MRRVLALEKRVEGLEEEVCGLKGQLNHAMMQRTVDREEAARLTKTKGPAREERLGRLREE